jgi:hypothetical protein
MPGTIACAYTRAHVSRTRARQCVDDSVSARGQVATTCQILEHARGYQVRINARKYVKMTGVNMQGNIETDSCKCKVSAPWVEWIKTIGAICACMHGHVLIESSWQPWGLLVQYPHLLACVRLRVPVHCTVYALWQLRVEWHAPIVTRK